MSDNTLGKDVQIIISKGERGIGEGKRRIKITGFAAIRKLVSGITYNSVGEYRLHISEANDDVASEGMSDAQSAALVSKYR